MAPSEVEIVAWVQVWDVEMMYHFCLGQFEGGG